MRRLNLLIFSFCSGFIMCLLAGCSGSQSNPAATSTSAPTIPAPTPTSTVASTPTATPAAGDMRTDSTGIEQVWVPAGSFRMGTSEEEAQDLLALDLPAWIKKELPSEQPQHEVHLTHGYWLDKHEVTNAAFQTFVDAGGYRTLDYWSEAGAKWLSQHQHRSGCLFQKAADKANYPCVGVNWYEAEAYAKWRGGRLPTEGEWEYAARGPQSLIYPWGNTFDSSKVNVVDSSGLKPVGSNPFVARSAYRHFEDPPDYADQHIGFRIVSPKP